MTNLINVLYDERVGGPQLRVLQVAQRLKEKGFATIVVMPDGDPTFKSMLDHNQIPHKTFKLVRLRQTTNPIIHAEYVARFLPNVRTLRRLIRECNAEIVHTNGVMNLQAAIAARLEAVPLVWHLNDVFTPKALRTILLPLVRSWSTQIAVAARAVGEHYFPKPSSINGRLRVLYAPVDTKRFNPSIEGSRIRAELCIPADCPLIGTVGNFDPVKGQHYLLEAVPRIRQEYPRAKFLFVGEALKNRHGYWGELRRRADALGFAAEVVFAGRREDMPEVYGAIDIYVHPSESEACPMAVMEASASGVPVVATDVGGTRELVEEGVTGLLIEPRNPAQIADSVIRVLADPGLARRIGTAGAERMRRYFSLDHCVEAHVRLYESVLGCKAVAASANAAPQETVTRQ